MPNRWVREDAIESETVNAVSWQAEVFWRRLLNRCDDFGRFSANLKILRSQVFPLQTDKVSELDVARLLSECENAGLLFGYKGPDGKPYLAMNKWEEGRAKHSKYPDPPPEVCERMRAFVYNCMQTQTNAPTSDFRLPTSDPDFRHTAKERRERAASVLSYLNSKAGRGYRETDANLKLIEARLREVDEDAEAVKVMIDRQCVLWLTDPKMSEYLRPETLFCKSKFGSYFDNRKLPTNGKGGASAADHSKGF